MARASVTTQKVTLDGLNLSPTAPTVDGDVIDCGAVMVFLENTTGAPVNVTVESPLTVDGLDVEDLVVAVPANDFVLVGSLPARTFGRPSGTDKGRAYVNYATPAAIRRAVFSL